MLSCVLVATDDETVDELICPILEYKDVDELVEDPPWAELVVDRSEDVLNRVLVSDDMILVPDKIVLELDDGAL